MLAVFGLEWRGSACPSSRPPVKLFSVSQGELRVDCDGGEDAAASAYGLGSFAQHHRGRILSTITIDAELALRHAEQLHRRTGGRTRGPSPFESEDREHFRESLQSLLCEQP